MQETFLAAFLACCLCTLVLPNKEVGIIRPNTFMVASLMTSGKEINLLIPILESIYKGSNHISNSNNPSKEVPIFPTHYVNGWLVHYFKTHHEVAQELEFPPMATYSSEGSARYFNGEEACKRIHRSENIVWASNILTKNNKFLFY